MTSSIEAPPREAIDEAIRSANLSPCQSKRGAVIFGYAVADAPLPMLSSAFNDIPAPGQCDGSDACKSTCRRNAVHAEQAALLRAIIPRGYYMLHVKTVGGELVPSGPPACVECSKLILQAGIRTVWLYHVEGWRSYTAAEFHTLSLGHATVAASRDEHGEEKCEGCAVPAVTHDDDGIPLCQECYDAIPPTPIEPDIHPRRKPVHLMDALRKSLDRIKEPRS